MARPKHITKYWLGKKQSSEHKRKIQESRKKYRPTEETKRKIGEAIRRLGIKPPVRRGKDNNKWKGGITSQNRKLRTSLEYRSWRDLIFKRDNYTCQKCYQAGGQLRAHHVENFADHKLVRFSVNNGITLCVSCHEEFHQKYGLSNLTFIQLNEFLCQL
jgi:hypothetical protein